MSKSRFLVKWQASDGYVGGARPQSFAIDSSDINPGASDKELEDLFWEMLEDDFASKVSADPEDGMLEEFLEWARGHAGEDEE